LGAGAEREPHKSARGEGEGTRRDAREEKKRRRREEEEEKEGEKTFRERN